MDTFSASSAINGVDDFVDVFIVWSFHDDVPRLIFVLFGAYSLLILGRLRRFPERHIARTLAV